MAKQYCPNCGAEVAANARACPACGAQLRQPAQARRERAAPPRRRGRRGRSRPAWPLTLLVGGGLVLIAAALLILLMQQTPGRNQLPAEVSDPNIPYPDVPRLPVAQAREGHQTGAILFVDTRSAENFEIAHIPGAISLPSGANDAAYTALPRDVQIVTYCT